MGVIAKTEEKENPSLCGAKCCIKGTVNVKAITWQHSLCPGGTQSGCWWHQAALHGSFSLEHKCMNSRLMVQLFWFSLHRHEELKSILFSFLNLKWEIMKIPCCYSHCYILAGEGNLEALTSSKWESRGLNEQWSDTFSSLGRDREIFLTPGWWRMLTLTMATNHSCYCGLQRFHKCWHGFARGDSHS